MNPKLYPRQGIQTSRSVVLGDGSRPPQDGNLMIAYPSTQGLKIAAKAPIMTRLSWTPPAGWY